MIADNKLRIQITLTEDLYRELYRVQCRTGETKSVILARLITKFLNEVY